MTSSKRKFLGSPYYMSVHDHPKEIAMRNNMLVWAWWKLEYLQMPNDHIWDLIDAHRMRNKVSGPLTK